MATHSASLSFDGSGDELPDTTMKNWMRELDPRLLIKSVVTVFHRWASEKREPGSDLAILGTRSERPLAAVDVQHEWERLADADPKEDRCPYSDRALLIKWAAFRRLKRTQKAVWYAFFDLPPIAGESEQD